MALSATVSFGFSGVIAGAVLSRGILPAVMTMVPNARDTGLSQTDGRPTQRTAAVTFASATVLALIFIGFSAIIAAVITAFIAIAVTETAKRKIGGQTGDVLGAIQILCETAVLILLLA